MNIVEGNERILEIIKEISEIEMNEIELSFAIFQREMVELINYHLDSLRNDIINAFEKPKEELVEEIINGYKDEFYRVEDKLEEQYINILVDLQEIQSNEKISIINCRKVLEKDIENEEKILSYVHRYIDYCNLENECYRMLNDCTSSANDLLNSVMKFEVKDLVPKEKTGILEKIRRFLKKVKYEDEYIKSRKETIGNIKREVDTKVEFIKNTTVKNISKLTYYKEKIKSQKNEMV